MVAIPTWFPSPGFRGCLFVFRNNSIASEPNPIFLLRMSCTPPQHEPLNLPAGVLGERCDKLDLARIGMCGQPGPHHLLDVRYELGGYVMTRSQDDEGFDDLGSLGIGLADHGHFRDRRMFHN